MKFTKKFLALILTVVLTFSCMSMLSFNAAAAVITKIEIVTLPTKLTFYQGTDWDYGCYSFPETEDLGTFVSSSTSKNIAFHHYGGYYSHYSDIGVLDMNGLVIKVTYSDTTVETITYKETVNGNYVKQNIYASPYSNYTLGTSKVCVYLPKSSVVYATYDIELLPAKSYSKGDVNMDSKINSSDALLVLQSAVNLITLTSEQKNLADFNSDSRINSSDALGILKYTVS